MNLVVVSPHLDDAVYSIGATISYLVRRRVDVTVVTVLAGDPSVHGPPSSWDLSCGFESAQEACRVRRAEDAEAVAVLGAQARWLPFPDDGYATPASRDVAAVAAALRSAVQGFEAVAVPAWPLEHPDHRWVSEIATSSVGDGVAIVGYAEQPYSSLAQARTFRPDKSNSGSRRRADPAPKWSVPPTTRADYRARAAAAARYRSQKRANRRLLWLAKAVRLIRPREQLTLVRGGCSEVGELLGGLRSGGASR